MDSVELVKSLCKQRKIAISRLEKDCGFANGYIRSLKEGKFPSDRLKKIADYFGVSIEYLTTGIEPTLPELSTENAELSVKLISDTKTLEMLKMYYTLSEKRQEDIINMIKMFYENEKGNQNE